MNGKDGVNGKDGRDGIDGKDGAEGAPGKDGADGLNGKDGVDGLNGKDGRDGIDGRDGSLPMIRAWSDGVHYAGDCVTRDGATWQAQRDTGRPPPHDDWLCIAAAGAAGRSMNICGTYDPDATYEAFDVVALNGGSFISLRDDPGQCPGDGWQLLVTRGKPGPKGDDGQRGPAGPPGRDGAPGQSVVSLVVDDTGLLRLTNGDGTEVEADFYPVLRAIK